MTEAIEDTQVWGPNDGDAVARNVEEEDETGAPEKVAWPKDDEEHPLESADEMRKPGGESGEDVAGSQRITADTGDPA